MLFMSVRPPEKLPKICSSDRLSLSPTISRADDISNSYHQHQQQNERRLFYRFWNKQWATAGNGRRSSPPGASRHRIRPLYRRLSSPLIGSEEACRQEMSTPVRNGNSNGWPTSPRTTRRSISLKFWRTEDSYCDVGTEIESLVSKIDVTCGRDVGRLCDLMRTKILKKHMTATEIAELVQGIYRALDERLRRRVTLEELTVDRADTMMKSFEEFFIRSIHSVVFPKISAEERNSDDALSKKIESLYWVTPDHLTAKIDESDPRAAEILDQALLDITAMNFMESVVEKLDCIMNCSRRIFDLLRFTAEASESADDFLPVMVYVVLQSNPPLLPSNIRYILQFGNSEKFMTGEEGYYFTHLCSAVSFIENASGQSLGVSEETFQCLTSEKEATESHSDDVVDAAPCRRRLSRYVCEAYHKAAEVRVVEQRLDKLQNRTSSLRQEVSRLKDDILSPQPPSRRMNHLKETGVFCPLDSGL